MSSPARTRIKYLTDGMLFRECMLDPLLSKYSVIMVRRADLLWCVRLADTSDSTPPPSRLTRRMSVECTPTSCSECSRSASHKLLSHRFDEG